MLNRNSMALTPGYIKARRESSFPRAQRHGQRIGSFEGAIPTPLDQEQAQTQKSGKKAQTKAKTKSSEPVHPTKGKIGTKKPTADRPPPRDANPQIKGTSKVAARRKATAKPRTKPETFATAPVIAMIAMNLARCLRGTISATIIMIRALLPPAPMPWNWDCQLVHQEETTHHSSGYKP